MQQVVHTIRLGSYNIRNGRNDGLESALLGMSQVNINLGVFQYINVTGRLCKRVSMVTGCSN